jgi:integrase
MTNYVLTDPIADLKLAALRPLDIGLFQTRLRERIGKRTGKRLSEKTVSCVINGTLRAMCRAAAVQDYLTRDVFVGLEWKKWHIPPADPLAPDEWDRVAAWFNTQTFQRHLKWRQHPAFHAFVYFLRWHGARPSEASALTWDNVDLEKSIAYIKASYHYREVCEPKTRAAERSVELHPGMVAILRELRPLRPEPGQPVFPNLDGNRITPKTFWDTWKRCLQACRIRHRGMYALKDTFVSYVLATAEETGEVERLTAWLVRQTGVRLDTLKQHYQRWWPRDTDAIAETYRLVDPSNWNPIGTQQTRNLRQTAKRKWTMSRKRPRNS